MPSSAVDLPITARSDAQPLQKVADVHVCPCLCQAPVCVSVKPSAKEEEEEEGEEGGCPSVSQPSLSVLLRDSICSRRFGSRPPSPPPPIDATKAGL